MASIHLEVLVGRQDTVYLDHCRSLPPELRVDSVLFRCATGRMGGGGGVEEISQCCARGTFWILSGGKQF